MVLTAVPYLGSIVSVVWGMFLMFTASIEVHKLARQTALIVFGILGAIFVFMNVSGEIASRKMAKHMEGFSEHMQGLGNELGDVQNMTPEQAGEAMGKFLKGLQKATEPEKEKAK